MDVFRVFDALNDPRNMKAALQAVRKLGGHAKRTFKLYPHQPSSYYANLAFDTTEQSFEIGIDSLVIKDMSGILNPMAAADLVREIKNVST